MSEFVWTITTRSGRQFLPFVKGRSRNHEIFTRHDTRVLLWKDMRITVYSCWRCSAEDLACVRSSSPDVPHPTDWYNFLRPLWQILREHGRHHTNYGAIPGVLNWTVAWGCHMCSLCRVLVNIEQLLDNLQSLPEERSTDVFASNICVIIREASGRSSLLSRQKLQRV